MKRQFLLFMILARCVAYGDDVTVTWENWDDNHLYDASGADLRTGTSRFQLVLDVDGDTDVGMMIASNYWAIGAEDAGTALYGAGDDTTVAAQNANWVLDEVHDWGGVGRDSDYDETAYASTRFYFRFFNAAQPELATEAGLIYHTTGAWVTASSAIFFDQAVAYLARTGVEGADLAGSTDGIHTNGWATMSAQDNPDQDGDGLPDVWENQFPGGTNMAPAGHSDADGLSDGDEYIAGTDPTNSASFFGIHLSRSNGPPVVWFTAREASGTGYEDLDRYYDLLSATNLVTAPWHGVTGFTNILGQDQVVTYTNDTGRMHFYKAAPRLE